MLSKGKRSHLTGCQDLNVLGQKRLKASVIICSVLARMTILRSESVKRFQRSRVARRVIVRTSVSIMERKTKLRLVESANQLTATKATRFFEKRSWGRFQKQANKQLRSSRLTLAVIKGEERKKNKEWKIIRTPESFVRRWYPSLARGVIEMAFS